MESPATAAMLALGAMLLTACQQQSDSAGSRTYPDAVVALHQVDPAYRPYFAAQNGSNYSLADQRAAYIKAAQTANGPMPHYEVRSSGTRVYRKPAQTKASGTKKGTSKKPSASKPSSKKPAAKKTAAKKPAAKKPSAQKKKK